MNQVVHRVKIILTLFHHLLSIRLELKANIYHKQRHRVSKVMVQSQKNRLNKMLSRWNQQRNQTRRVRRSKLSPVHRLMLKRNKRRRLKQNNLWKNQNKSKIKQKHWKRLRQVHCHLEKSRKWTILNLQKKNRRLH